MKHRKRQFVKKVVAALCLFLLVACSGPSGGGPGPGSGFTSAFRGLAHLVLSPVQVAAGLLEGISSIPYFLSMSVHEVNKGMIDAQAKITLDDTYESIYGKRLSRVPEDGDTGEVFRRMKHATVHFQKVLRYYGVSDYESYLLTSIDTASDDGYTLFAVVYRPMDRIEVNDRQDSSVVRRLTREDRLFYEPYSHDINGNALDTIIDWAGLQRPTIKTQKAQAMMITVAANSVVNHKRSPEYWRVEKRWMGGEYQQIAEKRMAETGKGMGV